ncbi:hypothetical protein CYY_008291 [Polysphondylium violaceum]|uniref:Uncharacterized protein n=1 Tax=Polysphondylium violaceum TaxID=133409 RepID=A0A8J4PLW4_9MYCE|nr:hypothetical protein CYY_008291 [Polysphondylium violaceum]
MTVNIQDPDIETRVKDRLTTSLGRCIICNEPIVMMLHYYKCTKMVNNIVTEYLEEYKDDFLIKQITEEDKLKQKVELMEKENQELKEKLKKMEALLKASNNPNSSLRITTPSKSTTRPFVTSGKTVLL